MYKNKLKIAGRQARNAGSGDVGGTMVMAELDGQFLEGRKGEMDKEDPLLQGWDGIFKGEHETPKEEALWGNLDQALTASTMLMVMQMNQRKDQGQEVNYWMDARQVVDTVNYMVVPEGWSTVGAFNLAQLKDLRRNKVWKGGQRMFQIRELRGGAGSTSASSSSAQEPTEWVIRPNPVGP